MPTLGRYIHNFMKRSQAPSVVVVPAPKRVKRQSSGTPIKPKLTAPTPKRSERKQHTVNQTFTTPATDSDAYLIPGPGQGVATDGRVSRAIKQIEYDFGINMYVNSGGPPNAAVRVIWGRFKQVFGVSFTAANIIASLASDANDIIRPYNPDWTDQMVIQGDRLFNLQVGAATGTGGTIAVPASLFSYRFSGKVNKNQSFYSTSGGDWSDWAPFVVILNGDGAAINGSFSYTQYYVDD